MIAFRFIICCGVISNHVFSMGFHFLQSRQDPWLAYQNNPTLFTIPRHRLKSLQTSHTQLHLLGKDLGTSIKSHQGVLLVQNNNEWNLICGHHWDIRGANVACRQLGFPMGALKATADNYNSKQHKFIYTDVQCFGNETELEECPKVVIENPSYECESKLIAGVVCRTVEKKCRPKEFRCSYTECIRAVFLCDGEKDCTNGEDEDSENCKAPIEVRLVEGPSNASGRVEVRRNGVWGTICDDAWDHKDAQVICRMIGFPDNPTSVVVHHKAYFGPGNGIVWLDNVRCTGKETSILDCPKRQWGKNNCGHEEDAGVTCLPRSAIKNNYDIFPKFCGRRLIHQHASDYGRLMDAGRIVGGHPSMPGSHPWQVGIRLKKQNGIVIHHCGGVILNEFYVLTAAHCFIDTFPLHTYIIRVGDFDNQVIDKEEQEFDIDFLIMHEEFGNGALFNNDISLVKIKPRTNGSGIQFGLYVQPICLSPEENFYIPGMHCMISGWGKINKHVYSERLQESEIPILPWIKCTHQDVYGPYRFTNKMFCAGYLSGGIDTCQGDSGGPLVCSKNDRFFLFGLVSWGDGCGDANKPGVYVRVQDYVHWIEKKIRENQ